MFVVLILLIVGLVRYAPLAIGTLKKEDASIIDSIELTMVMSEDDAILEQESATKEESMVDEEEISEEELILEEEVKLEEEESNIDQDLMSEDESMSESKEVDKHTDSGSDTYDEFFTNSIFVGDSVMEGFAQYVRGQRKEGVEMLSNAQFLTSVMGIKISDITGNTTGDSPHYVYKGNKQALETILEQMGVNRVFIMLGMNDLAQGFSINETIEGYREMISLIKKTNSDLDVIVMTTTPKTSSTWLPDYIANRNFDSLLLNEYADRLRVMCEEDGIKMIDINAAVKDPNGHLPDEYSRDNYVHINNECSAVVLDTIRKFAKTQ